MKKTITVLFAVIAAIMMTTAAAAAENHYSDVNGHWGKTAIEKWSSEGVLEGYKGKFSPDSPVTRGELAVILNRVLKYQVTAANSFKDLGNEFYADAVLKANAAGVMKGNGSGKITPKDKITRQDAVLMIARAFNLSSPSGYQLKATDASEIAGYAKDAVSAMESAGYISGRNGGKFAPRETITRAEIVQILNNMIQSFYTKAGTYSQDITGLVIVNTPNVTLKNITITGILVIAPGVGNGDFVLDNVKMKGSVVVLGGGSNSIRFVNNSSVTGSIIIKKVGDTVRIFSDKGIELPTVYVDDGCDDVILEGTFTNVDVKSDSKVIIPSGTTISKLEVSSGTNGAEIDNAGMITSLNISNGANKTTVNNTGTITTAEIESKTTVTGTGTIKDAKLTNAATGSTFETKPQTVEAPKGTKVTIGNTNYVSDGSELQTDTSGSGGGGGGGGGSSETTVNSVTLFINGTGITSDSPVNGTVTFNLTSRSGSDKITGIQINTSKASTYTVGGYQIETNKEYDMSHFLGILGLDSKANVTLSTLRVFKGGSFNVSGKIGSSDNILKVVFIVEGDSEDINFSYEMSSSGSTSILTAKILRNNEIAKVLPEGDPVTRLIKKISASDNDEYVLTIQKININTGDEIATFTKNYTFKQLSELNITSIANKLIANKFISLVNLFDLKQIKINISNNGKTYQLIFK